MAKKISNENEKMFYRAEDLDFSEKILEIFHNFSALHSQHSDNRGNLHFTFFFIRNLCFPM